MVFFETEVPGAETREEFGILPKPFFQSDHLKVHRVVLSFGRVPESVTETLCLCNQGA
jgi:hypothetical protein